MPVSAQAPSGPSRVTWRVTSSVVGGVTQLARPEASRAMGARARPNAQSVKPAVVGSASGEKSSATTVPPVLGPDDGRSARSGRALVSTSRPWKAWYSTALPEISTETRPGAAGGSWHDTNESVMCRAVDTAVPPKRHKSSAVRGKCAPASVSDTAPSAGTVDGSSSSMRGSGATSSSAADVAEPPAQRTWTLTRPAGSAGASQTAALEERKVPGAGTRGLPPKSQPRSDGQRSAPRTDTRAPPRTEAVDGRR